MDLDSARRIAAKERFLAVLCTSRPDGSIQASVVNAGFLPHPLSGKQVVGVVVRRRAVKLRNLRRHPRATAVFRSGGEWAAIDGPVTIAGPDDPLEGFDPERLPRLLRDVFTGAGGTHDDWEAYDRAMAEERRAAVLIEPARIYSNQGL